MRNGLKWAVLALGTAMIAGFAALSVWLGGVDQAHGFLRYGLTQQRPGKLQVGDEAPDVTVVGLDGRSRISLRQQLANSPGRPLVLVFGSYT